MTKQQLARRLLPWALRSLGLLILVIMALFGVDVVGGIKLIPEANPWYLLSAFAVLCLSLVTRMATWIFLAKSLNLGYLRLSSYIKIFLVGWSAALGLPSGVTHLVRAAALASDRKSVGRGVVIDISFRLLLITSALSLLAASAAYLSVNSTWVLQAVIIGVASIAGVVFLTWIGTRLLQSLLQRLRSHHRLRIFFDDASLTIQELRQMGPRFLGSILILGTLPPLLNATALFLISRSLGVDFSYPTLLAAWSLVSLTVLLPISINGLGPREAILTAAAASAGFGSEIGITLGLLFFIMQSATRLAAFLGWLIDSNESDQPERAQDKTTTI